MAVTVYFDSFSKKRNSTAQFVLSGATQVSCALKAPTSEERPTFLLTYGSWFNFNVAYWNGKYYFVDDVVSVRENQYEVSCVIDVLATYKSDITATSQFVAYADDTPAAWLADTRIPVLRQVVENHAGLSFGLQDDPFMTGYYVLTATGDTGTSAYMLTEAQISQLLASVNSWYDTSATDIFDGTRLGISYNFNTPEDAIESLSKIMAQSDVVGNAYSNAPQCIRSCIWVPLNPTIFKSAATSRLMLGSYDTGIDAYTLDILPKLTSFNCTIPWKYNDWRRAVAEDVSLLLPFLGQIDLPIDTVASYGDLNVDAYISGLDGGISYYVYASNALDEKLIGVYKCNCSCEYAIGINQRASLGDTVHTVIDGVSRAVSGLVESSIAPQSIAGSIASVTLEGVRTTYEVANVNMSHTPTTIGSMGAAGFGNVSMICSVLSHEFSLDVDTDTYHTNIGYPMMKTMALSGISGYCQCVNAHIPAAAQASELDALDGYVNSGFFIE